MIIDNLTLIAIIAVTAISVFLLLDYKPERMKTTRRSAASPAKDTETPR
jgi:hypothetical protein